MEEEEMNLVVNGGRRERKHFVGRRGKRFEKWIRTEKGSTFVAAAAAMDAPRSVVFVSLQFCVQLCTGSSQCQRGFWLYRMRMGDLKE